MRRTKILATLGPASESEEVLDGMIKAGLSAVRCNFSHGTAEDHKQRVEMVRKVAKANGVRIGILADLQGPKIRTANFIDGKIELKNGADFALDAELDEEAGDSSVVGLTYKALPNDVKPHDVLLLDDGRLELEVIGIEGSRIHTKVRQGGVLSNHKGINKLGGGLSAPALTEKDKADLITAAAIGVDYVAISFPRHADDMQEARQLLDAAGSKAALVSKIERVEAVENLDGIILASDAVMVARGDLAVEIGDEEVPATQKLIIKRARELDTVAITATQMMESMIEAPTPTRAEVSDVANAVLDGTDVVMLSAETAAGMYPVKVVEAMSRICLSAEKHKIDSIAHRRTSGQFSRVDEAIAMSAVYVANHLNVKAIISLTESGASALWMSRLNSELPIYSMTRDDLTAGLMTLYRGVMPLSFDSTSMEKNAVNTAATDFIKALGLVRNGDLVVLTSGDHMGLHGGTNKLKVLEVGRAK